MLTQRQRDSSIEDTCTRLPAMMSEPKIVEDSSAVCSSHMDAKLSLNARETQQTGQEEPRPSEEGSQSVSPSTQTVSNDASNLSNEEAPLCNDVSNLSIEEASEEQSSITPPPCKPAAWCTPKPKAGVVPEAGFIMEASSWPTLAEARHAKPSEARISPSQKATISISSPAQKVPSSQENSVAAPKHTNTNPPSKYRSSYRKGSYGKPNLPATENIPAAPMGVHVPSANMFNVDQSRKGNGMVGMNNFFPSLAPFPHHRGEGLAPFPHNAVVPPYGRGPPVWQQHHDRSYSDASYNHPGFVPRFDQQYIDPRNMQPPPMAPWQYHYPNIPVGDMLPYMPPAFSPGYTPYYGPSGPPVGIMQRLDFPTLLAMLRSQIEYYFSKENLIRDIYLTSKMDEEGFVPVSLIATFPRVKNLTSNSMHILESLKNSPIVEVKNGRLRSREWRRRSSGTSAQSPGIESLKSLAPSSNTGEDHAREQGTMKSSAPSSKTGVDDAREQATGGSYAPSRKTGVDHAREQATGESYAPSRKTGVDHAREQATSELLAASSNTGVDHVREQATGESSGLDHVREQGTGESKEFGEGVFDKVSTLIESNLIAESCAVRWTGLSVALNTPAVTSIDLR